MGGGLTFSNSRSGSNSVSWLIIPFVRPRSEGATRCYISISYPLTPGFLVDCLFIFSFFSTLFFSCLSIFVFVCCHFVFLYLLERGRKLSVYHIYNHKIKKKPFNHQIQNSKIRYRLLDYNKFKFILISSICIAFVSSWRENYEVRMGWRWRSIIGYALQLPKDCESGGLPRNMQSFMPMPLKQSI